MPVITTRAGLAQPLELAAYLSKRVPQGPCLVTATRKASPGHWNLLRLEAGTAAMVKDTVSMPRTKQNTAAYIHTYTYGTACA